VEGAAWAQRQLVKCILVTYKLALMSPSESCETLAAELGGIAQRGRAENAADLNALFDLTMKKIWPH